MLERTRLESGFDRTATCAHAERTKVRAAYNRAMHRAVPSLFAMGGHCPINQGVGNEREGTIQERTRSGPRRALRRSASRAHWFHDHALAEQSSLYGVRLSSAL